MSNDTVLLIAALVRELKRKHKTAKKLHQTVSGTVECPECQGVIDYRIDGYRWHSSGKCRICDLNWRE